MPLATAESHPIRETRSTYFTVNMPFGNFETLKTDFHLPWKEGTLISYRFLSLFLVPLSVPMLWDSLWVDRNIIYADRQHDGLWTCRVSTGVMCSCSQGSHLTFDCRVSFGHPLHLYRWTPRCPSLFSPLLVLPIARTLGQGFLFILPKSHFVRACSSSWWRSLV